MDDKLNQRLQSWYRQVEKITNVEQRYFELDAQEKSLYSQLFLKAEAKTVAEKEALAYASEDWINYKKGLAELKSGYNREKRILDVRQKAYEAEYLTYKIEADAVKRG